MVSTNLMPKENTDLSKDNIEGVDSFIDALIKKHSSNSESMNLMALEATSLATSVKSRSNELEGQGLIKGAWNSITGKNRKISARNSADLADSQYLGQKMLNKLAENNLMTYQMTVVLADKLNRVAEDAISAKQDFLELNQRLATFFESVRQKLEERFDSLQQTVELLQWKEIIEFNPVYNNKPYPELSRAEKIICLASEFSTITKLQWKPRDLPFLKSVIVAIGHHPTEKVSLKEVYSAYQNDSQLLKQLLQGIGDTSLFTTNIEMTPTLLAFKKINDLSSSEKHIIDTVLNFSPEQNVNSVSLEITKNFIKNQVNRDLDKEHDFFDVVMNLVEDLAIYKNLKQFEVNNENESPYNKAIALVDRLFESLPVNQQMSLDELLSNQKFELCSHHAGFPKREVGNKDELALTFTDEGRNFILLKTEFVSESFFRHKNEEISELRRFDTRLSVDGKTRVFSMKIVNNNENAIEDFIDKSAKDFSHIKPKLTNQIIISSKYLATNVLKVKFTYLKLEATNKV